MKIKNLIKRTGICFASVMILCCQAEATELTSGSRSTSEAAELAGDSLIAPEERSSVSEELSDTAAGDETEKEKAEKKEEERLAKRQEIVEFALQFVGNPYVYGGTSLTGGADCSGFVMSVFANFGYELPRVAASQYGSSRQKSLEEIEAGDLIFYGGDIHHVALYIGDGKVVHACNSATGIIVSEIDYETPSFAGTYLD